MNFWGRIVAPLILYIRLRMPRLLTSVPVCDSFDRTDVVKMQQQRRRLCRSLRVADGSPVIRRHPSSVAPGGKNQLFDSLWCE